MSGRAAARLPGRDRATTWPTTSRAATPSRSTGCATTARRVLHEALGDGGRRSTARSVRRAMLDAIRFDAFADAAPALHALRAGGLRLVVASNWDCSLPEVLADAGLLHLVDARRAVGGGGRGQAGRRACSRRRSRRRAAGRDEAIHVGDSLDNDVAGATAAGIAALLLVRSGDPPPGVPAIRSLVELPAVLGAGGRMLGRR